MSSADESDINMSSGEESVDEPVVDLVEELVEEAGEESGVDMNSVCTSDSRLSDSTCSSVSEDDEDKPLSAPRLRRAHEPDFRLHPYCHIPDFVYSRFEIACYNADYTIVGEFRSEIFGRVRHCYITLVEWPPAPVVWTTQLFILYEDFDPTYSWFPIEIHKFLEPVAMFNFAENGMMPTREVLVEVGVGLMVLGICRVKYRMEEPRTPRISYESLLFGSLDDYMVELCIKGRKFMVLGYILNRQSPYFKRLSLKYYQYNTVNPDLFEQMLQLLFSQGVEELDTISLEKLMDLLLLSQRFEVLAVQTMCETAILKRINIDTLPQIDMWNRSYGHNQNLTKYISLYMKHGMHLLLKQDEFRNYFTLLPLEERRSLIKLTNVLRSEDEHEWYCCDILCLCRPFYVSAISGQPVNNDQ